MSPISFTTWVQGGTDFHNHVSVGPSLAQTRTCQFPASDSSGHFIDLWYKSNSNLSANYRGSSTREPPLMLSNKNSGPTTFQNSDQMIAVCYKYNFDDFYFHEVIITDCVLELIRKEKFTFLEIFVMNQCHRLTSSSRRLIYGKTNTVLGGIGCILGASQHRPDHGLCFFPLTILRKYR